MMLGKLQLTGERCAHAWVINRFVIGVFLWRLVTDCRVNLNDARAIEQCDAVALGNEVVVCETDQALALHADVLTFGADPFKRAAEYASLKIQMALVSLNLPQFWIECFITNTECHRRCVWHAHHELIGLGKAVGGFGVDNRFGFVKTIDEHVVLKGSRPNCAFFMCAANADATIAQREQTLV